MGSEKFPDARQGEIVSDYPVLLRLEGIVCVVVGGGAVALRKAEGLCRVGARVRLVAPEITAGLDRLPQIELVRRPYREGDLAGAYLAFAATNDRDVNAAVAAEARRRGVLVNVADVPEDGDFTIPATLRHGDLTLCASTAGRSPALAAHICKQFARVFGPEWSTVLEIAAALRRKQLTLQGKSKYHQMVLERLIDRELPALIADHQVERIDELLTDLLGEGFSLAALGVDLPKGMP